MALCATSWCLQNEQWSKSQKRKGQEKLPQLVIYKNHAINSDSTGQPTSFRKKRPGPFSSCVYVPTGSRVINTPDAPFEQLASPREFQTLKSNFPTFWLFLFYVLSLFSLSRQNETGFWVAPWKDKRVSAAWSLFHPGKRHRLQVLGKAICSSWGDRTGLRMNAFWLLCLQLERPLRKPILQHCLRNCLYPSHLLFPSDGELPEMSQKLKEGMPGFRPERPVGLCFPGESRNAGTYLPSAGYLSLSLGQGPDTGLSISGGKGRIISGVPVEEKQKHKRLLLKYANHRPNSTPWNHKTNLSNF